MSPQVGLREMQAGLHADSERRILTVIVKMRHVCLIE